MLTALTHQPSPNINQCELTFLASAPIDPEVCRVQHKKYRAVLTELGLQVENLDDNVDLPDCAFIEDTAVVLDEIAIVTSMGADSRKEESKIIADKLARFRPVVQITPPAKIEGGDVLRIGNTLFVGISTRTNREGLSAIREIAGRFGYSVRQVRVDGCLHLKTACTAIDSNTVLLNSDWINAKEFDGYRQLEVPKEEPFAANILSMENSILIHNGFRKTMNLIEDAGYEVIGIDISEFLMAEAGLTCMSLIFRNEN